jgi:hypothetical protein
MKKDIFLVFTVQSFWSFITCSNQTYQKCAENYCLPNDYNKLAVPFKESGQMEISINFEILQILEIDDIQFTVSMLMYLGVTWEDHRISGPTPEDSNLMVPINIKFADDLWLPDIYIYDLKQTAVQKFYIPFAGLKIARHVTLKNGIIQHYIRNLIQVSQKNSFYELRPVDK